MAVPFQSLVLSTNSAGAESAWTVDARANPQRRTKIVVSLGPASWPPAVLEMLVRKGVDICRLNCSHRQIGAFEEMIPRIRQLSRTVGKQIEIIGDLQGPKFRVGQVDGGQQRLIEESNVILTLMENEEDYSTAWRITLKRTKEQVALMEALQAGSNVLLDDGALRMLVLSRRSPTSVLCLVTKGGMLKSRKGINVPDLAIDVPSLTDKDYIDLDFFLTAGVDYIALSFVQSARDIRELIEHMEKRGIPLDKRPRIIPKIEKQRGLENIDEILALCHGLMVARGDMGVEIGEWKVPFAQKMLIRKCRQAGKFSITATQMAESMINNPLPTRAEVSDMANAVFDGSDAIMFSAETAMGRNTDKVVEYAVLTLVEAESHMPPPSA